MHGDLLFPKFLPPWENKTPQYPQIVVEESSCMSCMETLHCYLLSTENFKTVIFKRQQPHVVHEEV